MTDLIACISSGGMGTWNHVKKVIESEAWHKIFLFVNEDGKRYFKCDKDVEYICLDLNKTISQLIYDIVNSLKDKVTDTEVALNLVSGSGKEHMAILAALLKLGLGIRLIALTEDGVKEI